MGLMQMTLGEVLRTMRQALSKGHQPSARPTPPPPASQEQLACQRTANVQRWQQSALANAFGQQSGLHQQLMAQQMAQQKRQRAVSYETSQRDAYNLTQAHSVRLTSAFHHAISGTKWR